MPVTRVAHDARAVEILTGRGWLQHVDPEFSDALLQAAVLSAKPAGQSISYAGDTTGSIWGVVEGQVDLTSGISAVDTPIGELALPGDWWGFRPLRRDPRAIHAVSRTSLLLAELPLSHLAAMLGKTPGWWRNIATLEALREYRWGGGMVDMMIRSSRLRCIAVLLRVAGCRYAGRNAPAVKIHFTQEQLAAAANISRYPTGTILRELAAAGLVELGYGTITVMKPTLLRAMVEADS